ncbi:MAG: Uma2 family endonuclease [Cyanobacteria bacterium J06560_6]
MVQAIPKLVTFQQFVDWLPESGRYELHNGVIVEMLPTGAHGVIVGLLNRKVNVWLDQQALNYFIPNTAIIQPLGFPSGYRPDLMLVDPAGLRKEPLWKKESVITSGDTVKLAIEVVSTNWPDDYARKFEDYEAMGIAEYWILDYQGLGGMRYIGSPKQPTATVCLLVDGVYETQLFRGKDTIVSASFPELQLSMTQVLQLVSAAD